MPLKPLAAVICRTSDENYVRKTSGAGNLKLGSHNVYALKSIVSTVHSFAFIGDLENLHAFTITTDNYLAGLYGLPSLSDIRGACTGV